MGEPGTLAQLLSFGKEQYPADSYALILWDHGGGPMEGLCWDELFSMDHLTLSELTDSLSAADLPEKLSFIGFDACLIPAYILSSAKQKEGAAAPSFCFADRVFSRPAKHFICKSNYFRTFQMYLPFSPLR